VRDDDRAGAGHAGEEGHAGLAELATNLLGG
jgi:hypothetical protein